MKNFEILKLYDILPLMEDWMSGLNQQFTKLSAWKQAREFESHILRKIMGEAHMFCESAE